MNKVFLFVPFFSALYIPAYAQYDDAASLSTRSLNLFNEDPVSGSAHYAAMGGANLASGLDISALKDNPAGIGMFTEESDFSITPKASFGDNGTSVKIANAGAMFVINNRHVAQGYTSSAFAFSFSQHNNYNLSFNTKGRDYNEKGGMNRWSVGYGANFGNRNYFGLGLNILTGKYNKQTNMADAYPLDLKTTATGFFLNASAIFNLRENINIAFALQSPTRTNINENNKVNNTDGVLSKPYTNLEYHTVGPMKMSAGFASKINWHTKINADYSLQNFCWMNVANSYDRYNDVDAYVDNCMKASHTFRLGIEVTPVEDFNIRFGGAYQTAPTGRPSDKFNKEFTKQFSFPKQNTYPVLLPHEAMYLCAGLGYTTKAFYVDMAYVFKSQDFSFYQRINNNSYKELTQHNSNILLTLGVRM